MSTETTTPPPVYQFGEGPRPDDRPSPMQFAEKSQYRTAAVRATQLYPGPVGELLARELMFADEFGWIQSADSLVSRLMRHILRHPGRTA